MNSLLVCKLNYGSPLLTKEASYFQGFNRYTNNLFPYITERLLHPFHTDNFREMVSILITLLEARKGNFHNKPGWSRDKPIGSKSFRGKTLSKLCTVHKPMQPKIWCIKAIITNWYFQPARRWPWTSSSSIKWQEPTYSHKIMLTSSIIHEKIKIMFNWSIFGKICNHTRQGILSKWLNEISISTSKPSIIFFNSC